MHASTNRKRYKNILNNSCVDFCNLFAIVEETLHRIPVAKTLLVNRQDQNASRSRWEERNEVVRLKPIALC
jgi:hypothetical protein